MHRELKQGVGFLPNSAQQVYLLKLDLSGIHIVMHLRLDSATGMLSGGNDETIRRVLVEVHMLDSEAVPKRVANWARRALVSSSMWLQSQRCHEEGSCGSHAH